ncbi:unnamed protein product [Cuscuta epithymum]|uniref:Uncharacterized protein n=1 Tax=Cuscuta epithymum TaxID=186058 RepID=A0AAV0FFE2_9ASTE|nr:unnamed protein product [Cuscuta epithymum]
MEARPHIGIVTALCPRHRHRLPLRRHLPPPLHPPPTTLSLLAPPHFGRAQHHPLPPLPRDGRGLLPRRAPPDAETRLVVGGLLPSEPDSATWAHIFLGPRCILFQDFGIRRHPFDPLEWVARPPPYLPPPQPPRRGGRDVIPRDDDVPDSASGGGGYQRRRARGDVQLLFTLRIGLSAAVEEGGDGVSDHPVCVCFHDFRVDAVLSFYRVGLLRDMVVVLQCSVRRSTSGAVHGVSFY